MDVMTPWMTGQEGVLDTILVDLNWPLEKGIFLIRVLEFRVI